MSTIVWKFKTLSDLRSLPIGHELCVTALQQLQIGQQLFALTGQVLARCPFNLEIGFVHRQLDRLQGVSVKVENNILNVAYLLIQQRHLNLQLSANFLALDQIAAFIVKRLGESGFIVFKLHNDIVFGFQVGL